MRKDRRAALLREHVLVKSGLIAGVPDGATDARRNCPGSYRQIGNHDAVGSHSRCYCEWISINVEIPSSERDYCTYYHYVIYYFDLAYLIHMC